VPNHHISRPPIHNHFRSLRRLSALIDAHATTPTDLDLCTATIFSNFPIHTGAPWRRLRFWTFPL
ncbi:hypothetical protein QBC45DRAFT_287959, partial [Copromyces sp. CBS 386.78]